MNNAPGQARPLTAGQLAAGALSLVLVISILIGSLLFGLILLNANRQVLIQRQQVEAQVARNLRSAMAYLLATPQLGYNQPLDLDLFGNGTDSVRLTKRYWGLFEIALAEATKSHVQDTAIALIGSRFNRFGKAALYLADEAKPLSLVGSSQILADCYLPAAGVRRATLQQITTTMPAQAITGQTRPSQAALPLQLDSALARVRSYSTLELGALLPAGAQVLGQLQSTARSFRSSPLLWLKSGPVTLRGVTLAGQIVLASAQRLIVEPDAHLDQVILIAPVVIIKQGFTGRVQVFARDTLEVQGDCQLGYPSTLCAFSPLGQAQVRLGPRTRISGVVIAAGPAAVSSRARVQMAETTQLEGQVLVDGTVENCGQIHGSLMCRRFVYTTPATFYENYLVNAVVDRTKLPADFLSAPLLNNGAELSILQWLH